MLAGQWRARASRDRIMDDIGRCDETFKATGI